MPRCDFCGGPVEANGWRIDESGLFETGDPPPWPAHRDCQALVERSRFAGQGLGAPGFEDWTMDDLNGLAPADHAEYQRLVTRAREMA